MKMIPIGSLCGYTLFLKFSPFAISSENSREIWICRGLNARPLWTQLGICQPRSVEAIVRLKSFHWKPSTCMGFLSLLLARNLAVFLSLTPIGEWTRSLSLRLSGDSVTDGGRDTKSKDTSSTDYKNIIWRPVSTRGREFRKFFRSSIFIKLNATGGGYQ